MKIIIALATLLTTSLTVEAQGDVLVSGQSFDYSFSSSSLSPIGPVGGGLGSAELYNVSLGWVADTFLSGSSVTLSLYETSTTEAPFQTVEFDGYPLGSGNSVSISGTEGQDSPAWQDLQGVVRLTVTAGSIELNQLGCETVVDGYRYGGFALIPTGAVPEPRSSTLLVVAFAFALTFKRRRTPPEKQDAQTVDNQQNDLVLFLESLPRLGGGWSANKTVQATPMNAAVLPLRLKADLCHRYGVPDPFR